MIIASQPLTTASYQTCSAKLKRGEVKRVTQRGPLIGYYVGCPACGFVMAHLHDQVEFEEIDVVESGVNRRLVVGMKKEPLCMRCKCRLVINEGKIEAHEQAG